MGVAIVLFLLPLIKMIRDRTRKPASGHDA
jgi:hypothetical protein